MLHCNHFKQFPSIGSCRFNNMYCYPCLSIETVCRLPVVMTLIGEEKTQKPDQIVQDSLKFKNSSAVIILCLISSSQTVTV